MSIDKAGNSRQKYVSPQIRGLGQPAFGSTMDGFFEENSSTTNLNSTTSYTLTTANSYIL